jgi:hypothetical protein
VKKISFLIILTLSVLPTLVANAQISDRSLNESPFFSARYGYNQVWDAQRSPSYPSAGREWILSGLKPALDASTLRDIDWGRNNDRYLKFDLESDRMHQASGLMDDRTGRRYNVTLKLYENNGRFVKTVSKWGDLIGFGSAGFMYVQEEQWGTLFTADRVRPGGVVSYRPDVAQVMRIAEIQGGLRGNRGRSDRMDDRPRRSDCSNMVLTSARYPETIDMRDAVRRDLGGNLSVADWNDLKMIPNIDAWIDCMGLYNEQSFFVTRNGSPVFSGKRHYIVQYFQSGRVPSGFLIHDQIGRRLFLGSWYDVNHSILAVRTEAPRREVREVSHMGNMRLTTRAYDERQNLNEVARREFRENAQMADWNDLRAIRDIDSWAMHLNIRPNDTFFVTKGGQMTYNRNRQYFVLYSPSGRIPAGFLAHDRIDNKLFLGSWYGENRPILVKE